MRRSTVITTMTSVLVGMASTLLSTHAHAADANATDSKDLWSATLGGGAWVHQRFPGSDSTYAQPLPYFDVQYDHRFFLASGDGLGAYLFRSHGGWMAVSIAPELRQRLQSDDDRLRGLGDVRRTARSEFQVGYAADCFTARGDVATDIAHRGQGTIFDLALTAHRPYSGPLQLESGIAAQWANGLFNRSFFGVTAAQSLASGLPEYSPGGGLSELRAFFGAHYAIDSHWRALGRIAVIRLSQQAADSPITERRNGWEFQLFVAYHLERR
jgi:MipA family protein